jgi:single-strand DNA-binding protein
MSKLYSAMIPNALAEVTLVGRVTRDGESRFTQQGTKVANVSVAVSRRYNQDNEWKEVTSFISLSVWGDAADRVNSIRKGDIISATFSMADMKANAYTTTAGEQRVGLEVSRAQVSRVAWANGEAGDLAPAGAAEIPAEDDIPF